MIPFGNLLGGAKINTAAPGDAVFEGANLTTTWTVPSGVYEVSIVAASPGANGNHKDAGGQSISGGGGDGGDLRWGNSFPVTPGQVLRILIIRPSASGAGGSYAAVTTDNYSIIYLLAGGASGRLANDAVTSTALGRHPVFGSVMIGGGDGGDGVVGLSNTYGGGGGGAGGYSGAGGKGSSNNSVAGNNGAGGGAAGGRGSSQNGANAFGGGGVGLYGEGASGSGQNGQSSGGSGGEAGTSNAGGAITVGARYGGGGAGLYSQSAVPQLGGLGGLRILWGQGPNNGGRAFPATNVATATS